MEKFETIPNSEGEKLKMFIDIINGLLTEGEKISSETMGDAAYQEDREGYEKGVKNKFRKNYFNQLGRACINALNMMEMEVSEREALKNDIDRLNREVRLLTGEVREEQIDRLDELANNVLEIYNSRNK